MQLDVLGDECARTILVATSDRPRTAKELTELTDCSSATVYRRLNNLLESDLLSECIRFDEDGSHSTAYEATVGHLSVAIDDDGIDVSAYETDDVAKPLLERLEELPLEAVNAGVEDRHIDIRITIDADDEEELSRLRDELMT